MIKDTNTLEKLSALFMKHLTQSRMYKKSRLDSWKKVDDMIANKKIDFNDSVIHIPLSKANGFLKVWLSKIDNPLSFKYMAGEVADTNKALIMNAIREKDKTNDRWDWKDLMGKTQAGCYGRTIYFYTARSPKGKYESELSLIDVLRFHIDPKVGGEDIEKARWLGWGKVELTREDIEEGVKSGEYLNKEAKELLSAEGNTSQKTTEDLHEDYRYNSINNTGKTALSYDEDLFTFYRWFETINNQRYVILVTNNGLIIQAKKIEDVWESGLYPVWSWAPNTSLTEFWTLGEIEYQMYVFIAQEASISQMVENSDKVNKPQRAVNIEKIKNLSQVKYRRDSVIEVENEDDVRRAIVDMPVPSIQTPMIVYDKLEFVQASATGITPGAKGMADEDKVTIYEGNMQAVGDIFGLLNKSYAEGYWHFAQLHKAGVMEHLTKAMAIKIIGVDGIKVKKVTKKDIKSKSDYDILIESSNAETQTNNIDKKNKLSFIAGYKGDPNVNQKVLFRFGADTVGFGDDETKRMLDLENDTANTVITDANEIFQKLLANEKVDLYEGADTTFLQELIKLYWNNKADINNQKVITIEQYIESLMPIMEQNMSRKMVNTLSKEGSIDPRVGGKANLRELGEDFADQEISDSGREDELLINK